MSKATFQSMSREQLEDELNRCNDIMGADGRKIGEMRALIGKLEILARGFHDGRKPSGNVDDLTRRSRILSEANAVIREHFIDKRNPCEANARIWESSDPSWPMFACSRIGLNCTRWFKSREAAEHFAATGDDSAAIAGKGEK